MLAVSSYSLDPTLLTRNNMDRSPIAPGPSAGFSAPKRKRDDGTMMAVSGPTGLSIIEAPETRRFNSPLPASANDTRKPGTKMGRFQDMTAKGAVPTKRPPESIDVGDMDDDDDDDDEGGGGKRKYANKRNATSTGRRKIDIEYIEDKSKRHVSFTKRKAGLMKKAYELSTLTGTNCLVLVVSETGLVYTYATPGLKPVIAHEDGKAVIAASLRGDLKLDESEYTPVPVKRTKSASKSTEPEVELPEEPDNDLMIDDHDERALPPLPLPDLSQIDSNQHRMFDDDHHGMMDPSLRYLGDYNNLFSSSAGGSSNSLLPTSLPPLPFPSSAEAPYSLPPSITPQPIASTSASGFGNNANANSQASSVTAYSRGIAEAAHAQAFQNYNTQSQFGVVNDRPMASAVALAAGMHRQPPHGAHEFGEAARNWLPSSRELAGEAAGGQKEGTMAERKKAWKEEAALALTEALNSRTIPTYIHAHALYHKATLPIPPPRNSAPTTLVGIECTMDHFRAMCEGSAIRSLDFMGPATKAFLDSYLASTLSYTPKMVNEAKTHLTNFFDFLEGNGLITTQEQDLLNSFETSSSISHTSAPTQTTTPTVNAAVELPVAEEEEEEVDYEDRGAEVEKALAEWSAECSEKFKWVGEESEEVAARYPENRRLMRPTPSSMADKCAPEQVGLAEGWFEVYRVRKNYCLLKERQMKGSPEYNLLLSPYKVRLPRSIARKIKIEDAVWLKLMRLAPRGDEKATPAELVGRPHVFTSNGEAEVGNKGGSWVPVESSIFYPAPTDSSNIESDIDPASYAEELESMLLEAGKAPTEETRVQIQEHKDVLGMLERARDRLAEGELSDC